MSSSGHPELRVEAKDDQHSIIHLVAHHGIQLDEKRGPVLIRPSAKDTDSSEGSVQQLLIGMEQAIRLSINRPIGFVLDADENPQSRWKSIRTHLQNVGVNCPNESPEGGLIAQSSNSKATVGVWLMPDNASPGRLEDFLTGLIRDSDPLIDHAKRSAAEAKGLGAKFPEIHLSKATIHTWLAWQETPGRPLGVAVKAKYFQPDAPKAKLFVAWFRKLYGEVLAAAPNQ